MDNRYLTAAITMAYHNRGRVKVVEDKISPLYFTRDVYRQWMTSLQERLPRNTPPYRRAETVMKTVNGTIAGNVLAQTAFTERSLKTAVLLGAKQYLMLDAGYDTFAYRQPDWAQNMWIFEINPLHIAMDKQARLTRAEIETPENVNYIYADIYRHGWEKLLTSHPVFVENAISFVNLRDIACYMDKQQFKTLMQQTVTFMAAGSSVVFSYNALDYEQCTEDDFPFGEMEKLMSGCGLLIYEQLTPQEAEQQFFTQFNYDNIRTPLKAPQGVNYILAVKK